jgi:hypothetical protein
MYGLSAECATILHATIDHRRIPLTGHVRRIVLFVDRHQRIALETEPDFQAATCGAAFEIAILHGNRTLNCRRLALVSFCRETHRLHRKTQ